LILLGLMLQAGWTLVAVKLLMIGLLVFFVSPTASHALARAACCAASSRCSSDDAESSHRNPDHQCAAGADGAHVLVLARVRNLFAVIVLAACTAS
jgi:hypothetical protein